MTGAELIEAERQRQVSDEGWSAENDNKYLNAELMAAAICYAHNAGQLKQASPRLWPWSSNWWKPTCGDPIRDLVKAGALIAAEIDRRQRALTMEIPSVK